MMQRPLFLQPDFLLKSYYQHILKKFHCLLQLNSMNRRNNFHIAATKSLPYQRIYDLKVYILI